MAHLLDGKEITFQYFHTIELDNDKVKVYYTEERINKIKSIDNNDEIKDIINNSYLMCEN